MGFAATTDGQSNLLDYLSQSNQPLEITRALIALGLAFVLGLFIFFIYKRTFRGVIYTRNFNLSLIMTCMITTLVILPITTNILLSLGMVGALSIVRYRASVKDPVDIAFMFWAIAVGITVGAEFYLVAVIGCVIIGVFTLIAGAGRASSNEVYLLVVRYGEGLREPITRYLPPPARAEVRNHLSGWRGAHAGAPYQERRRLLPARPAGAARHPPRGAREVQWGFCELSAAR